MVLYIRVIELNLIYDQTLVHYYKFFLVSKTVDLDNF